MEIVSEENTKLCTTTLAKLHLLLFSEKRIHLGYFDLPTFCRNSRAKPIIVDPGLYSSKKSDLYFTTQRRSLPSSFKLFTGMRVYLSFMDSLSIQQTCFFFEKYLAMR
jgi:hypothetical protein